MTVPLIDGVDHENFEYRPVYQGDTNFRGIFEWGMLYKENEVPEKEAQSRTYNSEPYKYLFKFYSNINSKSETSKFVILTGLQLTPVDYLRLIDHIFLKSVLMTLVSLYGEAKISSFHSRSY